MAETTPTRSVTEKTRKSTKRDYIYAVGRRREAVARVRLHTSLKESYKWGEHDIVANQILVNEMPVEKYFPGSLAKASYMHPIKVTGVDGNYAFTIKLAGGGKKSQLDAMIHGISRALAKIEKKKHRHALKEKGLLTRDPRVRERRKVGTGGKARRKKQSPKR